MDNIEPVQPNPNIDEDTALAILIDILSNTPLWQKDPNVKICCKAIGAKIINLETKIDGAVSVLLA
jgi:hypothetical protein